MECWSVTCVYLVHLVCMNRLSACRTFCCVHSWQQDVRRGTPSSVYQAWLTGENGMELPHLRCLSSTLAQDENWFLCKSAVFLSWYGVLSVVRWSSVTARWSYVVCLWSLSTIRQIMVWVAPLAVANEAVDCGSVGSSTARWSHMASGQYRGVSSLMTLLWQSSCHGGMGNLFGGHCHRCSFYRTFLLVLWTLFYLCVWHLCAFYVRYVSVFFLCVHMPKVSIWMSDWVM